MNVIYTVHVLFILYIICIACVHMCIICISCVYICIYSPLKLQGEHMHGLFRVELIAATLEGPRNRLPSTPTPTNTNARSKATHTSSSNSGGGDKAGKRGRKKATHKEVNMDADDDSEGEEEGDENDEGQNYDLHDHQQQAMDEESKEENTLLDARVGRGGGGKRLNDRSIDLDADFDGAHLLPPRPSSSHSHSSISTGIATKRKMGQNYDPQCDDLDDGRITSSLYTHPVRGTISTNAPAATITVRSPIRNSNNPNSTNAMNNSFSSTSRYPPSSTATGQYSSTENSPYNHNTTRTTANSANNANNKSTKGGEKKAHMSKMLLRDDD